MTVSIRSRLTLWYAVAMLAALAIFGVTAWFALQGRLMAGVDARLAQRMQGIRNSLGNSAEIESREQLVKELAEFLSEVPDGTVVQLRDGAGSLLPGSRDLPPAARRLVGRLDSAGERWDLLVALPLDEQRAILGEFRGILLLLIPVALALACAGGYWLSTRALRPVDEMTAVARSIGVQNLSQRIPVAATGDEIERMGRTWNDVLDRLDSAVQRIRQFTADASHELRSPLALIRATAELALRKDRDSGAYRRALEEIQAQAELMTELTESLLTLSRADSDSLPLALEPTDLGPLIASEVRQSRAVAEGKGVMLATAAGGDAVIALGNGAAIQRLLRILIDNAIRYTPEGGSVTVSAASEDGGAVLRVQDTGEGIAASDLLHIFERFYRADQVRGSGSGFGLGLSIAQAIAQAHRSKIEVESAPGVGSTFSLRFSSAASANFQIQRLTSTT
jgi:signal transduction histidine kinase